MPGPLGPMGFFEYLSDNENTYVVHMNVSIASAGGFSPSSSEEANYPRGWQMRHVYGEQTDGTRVKIPVAQPTFGLYTSGGSATVHGASYECAGGIGEKRPRA